MQRANEPVLNKVINNGGDVVASIAVVGIWGEIIPLVFGVLGGLWFCLRFINFIRVNVFNKEPWSMR